MNKRVNTARFCAVVLLVLVGLSSAESLSRKYTAGESIPVWADRVGPFNNPLEYYLYFKLPFCKPETTQGQIEGLGESILGYELRNTMISVSFGVPTRSGVICKRSFNELEMKRLTRAISRHYWYQFFIDDLPVWGTVGEIVQNGASKQLYLYTHLSFDIARNGEHIVEVNMTSEGATLLKDNMEVTFTYSVNWRDSNTPVVHRFDKYLDKPFHEHQVHWFSFFNALMLVAFLLGLVGIILLRTLRKDYVTLGEDDTDDDLTDETGWKLLHRDVFRSPKRLVLFSALVGAGYQMGSSFFILLLLGTLGAHYYEVRGSFLTGFIAWYLLSSIVGGYTSGGLFARYKGTSWIKTALSEASLVPVLFGIIGIASSIVARTFGTLSFIPFFTVVALGALWVIIQVPLTLVGTLLGRHLSNKSQGFPPSGTQSIPRMIPQKAWYQQRGFLLLVSGLLPFSSIFIELYFVYAALWHYKFYYTYGFCLIAFVTLIVVVMCVDVISTYFLLNSEDHRWQWNSYLSGASVGFYIFVYSLYHFFFRTNMSGFVQFTLYLSHSLAISLFVALICGSVGFFAANTFVNRIYRGLKAE